jgi:putative transposase
MLVAVGHCTLWTMRWLHRVRLYPTQAQAARLTFMLHVTRDLYNAALQQRRDVWHMRRRSVTHREQYAELTQLRRESPRLRSVYREVEDAVLHRLDLAFAAFFRRHKRAESPGFPRYKPASRWSQLEFPHGDRALKLDARQRRVRIPGVGTVALRKGREIPEFGRVFVVEKNGRWYAVFEGEREPQPVPATGTMVGMDRGIRALIALSEGTRKTNPKHVEVRHAAVVRHQRDVERRTERDARGRVLNRRDPRRIATIRRLARAKEREASARRDALHKLSRELVLKYDVIAVEALRVRNMVRSAKGTAEQPGRGVRAKARLNRAIADAGWGMLVTLMREKAEWAARAIVEVSAVNTSRTCAECGHVATQSREGTRFWCVGCGHRDDADVNAARVILARAQSALATSGLSPGTTRLVQHDAA